jgi:hypothetical protein
MHGWSNKPQMAAGLVIVIALASTCTSSSPSSRNPTSPSGNLPAGPNASPLPQGAAEVSLDPADFTGPIDHPYWPMRAGSTWEYSEVDAEGTVQRVDVTVTDQTKEILGIQATVVHDVVTEGGEIKEDTFDWYAQDSKGNLWYLGEDTKEYENGKVVSTKGSWEAGVDGAQPGIILPANPEAGMVYREEYLKGEAEDAARVLSVDELAQVPFGSFDHVLMTKNYTPLVPDLLDYKFYARGIGLVLAIAVSGGSDREELLTYQQGSS